MNETKGHFVKHLAREGLISPLRSWVRARRNLQWWQTILEPVVDARTSRALAAARDRGRTEPTEIQLRGGLPLLLRPHSTDLEVLHKVFVANDYRFPLPQPGTIIDAGAYIGLTSLWFHREYPGARIVAVEADAANFALLQQNTQAVKQIECVHAALWHDQSGVGLGDPGLGAWGMRVDSHPSSTRVPSIDVACLMQSRGWSRLGLLKLDIEGAEKQVLEHSTRWLPSCDAIVAELHDRYLPGCSRAFFRATDSFEFDAVRGENVACWRAPS